MKINDFYLLMNSYDVAVYNSGGREWRVETRRILIIHYKTDTSLTSVFSKYNFRKFSHIYSIIFARKYIYLILILILTLLYFIPHNFI